MENELCTIETWLKFPGMTWEDYDDIMEYIKQVGATEHMKKVFSRKSDIKDFAERTKEYIWDVLKGKIEI